MQQGCGLSLNVSIFWRSRDLPKVSPRTGWPTSRTRSSTSQFQLLRCRVHVRILFVLHLEKEINKNNNVSLMGRLFVIWIRCSGLLIEIGMMVLLYDAAKAHPLYQRASVACVKLTEKYYGCDLSLCSSWMCSPPTYTPVELKATYRLQYLLTYTTFILIMK